MGNERWERAGTIVLVVVSVVGSVLGAASCASDDAGGASPTRRTVAPTDLSDAQLAALEATKAASSFHVVIEGADMPTQSLRYVAPFSYESTDPANPVLVVDGVQYDRIPSPPDAASGATQPYVGLPLGADVGGPPGFSVPFFLQLLEPTSSFGGPGYRIVDVEIGGGYATVVHAENLSGPITLRFADVDEPATPLTAPPDTMVPGEP